jgi:hypothetical protein
MTRPQPPSLSDTDKTIFIEQLSNETADKFKALRGNESALRQALVEFISAALNAGIAIDEAEDILGINDPSIMDIAQLSTEEEEILIDAFETYINEL